MANKRSSKEIESETKKNMIDGEEGINSLPDAMLHHILSFVTMEEAIQTSLISKRWRYLWTCIPTLNFTNKRSTEFVDDVLILRENGTDIKRFNIHGNSSSESASVFDSSSSSSYFSMYSDSDSDSTSNSDSDNSYEFRNRNRRSSRNYNRRSRSPRNPNHKYPPTNSNLRFKIWILAAIKRNVEEIHLETYFDDKFRLVKFPHCLFTCESLRKLELISLDETPQRLSLPESIRLPRLKILHLGRFLLDRESDDKINHFLLNCCSGLESLTLKGCGFHNKNIDIIAPNLKHLVISETSYNVGYLRHSGVTGSVKLYTPKLLSFHCEDYLLKSYCLENLSSLVEAHIDIKVRAKEKEEERLREKGGNGMIHGERIAFSVLPNMKHLELSAWALQILIVTYGLLDGESTEFDKLRSLKLQTWFSRDCIHGITCLLNMSPNIVKLSLEIIEDKINPIFPRWDEIKLNLADIGDYLKLPLLCVLDHLKLVEIRGLKGRVNELKFLEVLLRNAVILEELILCFSYDSRKRIEGSQLIEYSKILKSFPRASKGVSFLFISS